MDCVPAISIVPSVTVNELSTVNCPLLDRNMGLFSGALFIDAENIKFPIGFVTPEPGFV